MAGMHVFAHRKADSALKEHAARAGGMVADPLLPGVRAMAEQLESDQHVSACGKDHHKAETEQQRIAPEQRGGGRTGDGSRYGTAAAS